MSRKNSNVSVSIIIRFLTHDEKPNCWMSEQRWKNKTITERGNEHCVWSRATMVWLVYCSAVCLRQLRHLAFTTDRIFEYEKKKKKSQPPGIASYMGCRLDFSLSWTLQVYQFFSVFAGKKRKGIPLTKVVVGVHRQPTMIPELKVFCNGFCLFCASPVSVRYISDMFAQRFFLKFYKELIIIILIIIIIIIMFLFFKKLQLICLKKKKKTIHSKHYLQFLSI